MSKALRIAAVFFLALAGILSWVNGEGFMEGVPWVLAAVYASEALWGGEQP